MCSEADLNDALELGMDWSVREGYAWAEDKEHCEEYGRMLQADPRKVSSCHTLSPRPRLVSQGAARALSGREAGQEERPATIGHSRRRSPNLRSPLRLLP